MDLFFISDNRTDSNWGCRATSLALSESLRSIHTISGTMWKASKIAATKLDGMLNWNPEQEAHKFFDLARQNEDFAAIIENFKKADAAVINGEGDMIFSSSRKTLNFLLVLMDVARMLGKPVFYINAMVSDCPQTGRDPRVFDLCMEALRGCAGIMVRDPFSFRLLQKSDPDLPAVFAPDALFNWPLTAGLADPTLPINIDTDLPFGYEKEFGRYNFKSDYICIGGSSLAKTLSPGALEAFYRAILKRIRRMDMPVYLVECSQGDKFLRDIALNLRVPLIPKHIPLAAALKILANARVFVSGRYHPSIMASLGGVPFVSLSSNSHKMRSLQKVMGSKKPSEHRMVTRHKNCDAILEEASCALHVTEGVRHATRRKTRDLGAKFSTTLQQLLGNI
ncbi:MAG: polysaccharide pyruvyl transferase family protein [Verrucomicrobiota bacterium]